MILWSRVNELREEVGAEDFKEVVALFLDEVEEVIDRLRADTNRDRLEQDLHFLKAARSTSAFPPSPTSARTGSGWRHRANPTMWIWPPSRRPMTAPR